MPPGVLECRRAVVREGLSVRRRSEWNQWRMRRGGAEGCGVGGGWDVGSGFWVGCGWGF